MNDRVPHSSEYDLPRRPHHVSPSLEGARIVLAAKNFMNIPGVCHVGLTITATCTMRVLRRHGIHVEVWPVQNAKELSTRLRAKGRSQRPVTHVVVSAPSWVSPHEFGAMCREFGDVEFVQLNHSGTAYLSIDHHGIRNIRECIDMERELHNMRVGFNNPRGARWAQETFGGGGLLLPNLYDTESFVHPSPPRLDHDPIRIGSFGAARPWKNQLTAAEAAIQLARRLGVGLEFYVNSGRMEKLHGGERLVESRKELFAGLPQAKLIEVPWALWPKFRQIIRTMDLMFSPSFDETFCVVVADGIAEGVPSVVTGAMEWTPPSWWCEPYDPTSLTKVAMGLLHDRHAIHDAQGLLIKHVKDGVSRWIDYVTCMAAKPVGV